MSYNYPGNVRELENAIEHAFARTTGNIITEQKLPLAIRQRSIAYASMAYADNTDGECQRILRMLERAHWNRNRAAQLLGISRITLWRRMKALGLLDKAGT